MVLISVVKRTRDLSAFPRLTFLSVHFLYLLQNILFCHRFFWHLAIYRILVSVWKKRIDHVRIIAHFVHHQIDLFIVIHAALNSSGNRWKVFDDLLFQEFREAHDYWFLFRCEEVKIEWSSKLINATQIVCTHSILNNIELK